jgi:hypothetical protein
MHRQAVFQEEVVIVQLKMLLSQAPELVREDLRARRHHEPKPLNGITIKTNHTILLPDLSKPLPFWALKEGFEILKRSHLDPESTKRRTVAISLPLQ